jgi:hypothetical protein
MESYNHHGEPCSRVSLPIEVSGFDRHGRFFTERTFTSDVSDRGCKFAVRAEVEIRSAVAIRVTRRKRGAELNSRPVLFELVRVEVMDSGWVVAAIKLQAAVLWPVDPGGRINGTDKRA